MISFCTFFVQLEIILYSTKYHVAIILPIGALKMNELAKLQVHDRFETFYRLQIE